MRINVHKSFAGAAVCVLGVLIYRMDKGKARGGRGSSKNYAFKPLSKKEDALFSDDSDDDIGIDQ